MIHESRNGVHRQNGQAPFAARLLECMAEEGSLRVDLPVLRRAVAEASHVWPGEERERWWKWATQAGISLGVSVKAADCTLDAALEFAWAGVPVATCLDGDTRSAVVLCGARGRRYRVVDVARGSAQWLLKSELAALLGGLAGDQTLRWVILEPATTCPGGAAADHDSGHDGGHPHATMPPFTRLRLLLRPEWSDLWTVLLFAMFSGILYLAIPIAVETLVNMVAFGRLLQPVIILSLILLVVLGFAAAVRAMQTWVVEIIQRRLFIRVAADLAWRLPRVRQEAFDRSYGPELVNRFFDVVAVQKVTSHLLLDGVALVLQAAIGMTVLAFYHPWLLGFDVMLLGLMALMIFVLGRGAIPASIKASKAKFKVGAWLQELSRSPAAFRLDGAAEFAAARADALTTEYFISRRARFRVLMRQIGFTLAVQAVASTVLLGLGGWLVIRGELTLGQLVAAELIVTVILSSFAKLGKHIEGFYDLLAAVDKLGVLFDLPLERQDGLIHVRELGGDAVELRGVSYHYPGRPPVLEHVDLALLPGERVGLAGPSGCGKSTLLDLLYRLRVPTAGHVELDEIDIRDIRPDVLRRHVALVRSIEIFEGTIAENIHLERPDVSASDIRDALAHVGLLDELLCLPDGLNTRLVSGGGAPLTQSQARRLMLARGIAGRPRLLLIDGLLDGLSDECLERLLPDLFDSAPTWTLLVASGRYQVLDRCDRTIDLGRPATGVHRFRELAR